MSRKYTVCFAIFNRKFVMDFTCRFIPIKGDNFKSIWFQKPTFRFKNVKKSRITPGVNKQGV